MMLLSNLFFFFLLSYLFIKYIQESKNNYEEKCALLLQNASFKEANFHAMSRIDILRDEIDELKTKLKKHDNDQMILLNKIIK